MKAGLVHENDLNLSGTNAYLVVQSGLSLPAASVLTAAIGSGAVLAVNISGQQVTSVKQAFVGTGSPAVYGNSVQFGTGTLTTGSIAWITFNPPFAGTPVVVATSANDSAINIIGAGSGTNIGVGSVRMLGTTASTTFYWIAAGSL